MAASCLHAVQAGDVDQKGCSVLFLSFAAGVHGGAEKSLLLLLGGLDREAFRPLLVVPAPGDLAKEASRIGVRVQVLDLVHHGGSRIWDFLGGLRQLRRVCRQCHTDLIHCNSWEALQWAVPVAASLHIPLICHFRSLVFSRRRMLIYLLNRSDLVIAISSAVEDRLVQAGVKKEKVVVIHNAVDLTPCETCAPDGYAGWSSGRPAIVGMASRLLPWKGHRFFLQAASKVIEAFPNAEFWIVGDARPDGGTYAAELLDMVRQLGLERHVRFLGYQEDIVPFMRSLDLLVLPSDNEPFGRVLIEAMAAAKPVVAFQGGGVVEIVDHEVSGLLVPPRDVEGLAIAIQRLIGDRTLAQTMGRAGRAKVERCFTVEGHVNRVQEVYRSALGIAG